MNPSNNEPKRPSNRTTFRRNADLALRVTIVASIVALHLATGVPELAARAMDALVPEPHGRFAQTLKTMDLWAGALIISAMLANLSATASRKLKAGLEQHRVHGLTVWLLGSSYMLLLALMIAGIWRLTTNAPPDILLLGSVWGLHGLLFCLTETAKTGDENPPPLRELRGDKQAVDVPPPGNDE